ncbi:hypothetical protein LG943_07540 [Streptomonospora sp. S1-112]|uniref:Uncharacterized protein n=1 Tax=Streptomonospora mangrovi TaxID=2883123 RepID=A0A9X3SGI2_9ACTN|nr:hypothetical protein [Streptomonospora mangrovi]MDA0564179.1 hypothetical protein [Streptomonospora mangrovi]
MTSLHGLPGSDRVPDLAGFPGRRIGGTALVAAPLLWCAGLVLRYLALRGGAFTDAQLRAFEAQPFMADAQLAAYEQSPLMATAAHALFAAGAMLLVPAFAALARVVAPRYPRLAAAGALLVVLGLLGRMYAAGVDAAAFALVDDLGLGPATATVNATYTDLAYGPWRVPVTAYFGQYAGVLLLAVGAHRSGVLSTGRTALLLLWGALWCGVLKEATLVDCAVAAAAAALVFAPLGARILRGRAPGRAVRPGEAPATAGSRLVSW